GTATCPNSKQTMKKMTTTKTMTMQRTTLQPKSQSANPSRNSAPTALSGPPQKSNYYPYPCSWMIPQPMCQALINKSPTAWSGWLTKALTSSIFPWPPQPKTGQNLGTTPSYTPKKTTSSLWLPPATGHQGPTSSVPQPPSPGSSPLPGLMKTAPHRG